MSRVIREHGIALGVFVLLTLVMTIPVVFSMNSSIAGAGGDPWQTMWRFQAKADSGISGFFSDIFGTGEPRLSNLSVWPWMPLHLIFGQPFAYNTIWLFHFVLAGYAMALFVKILTRQESIINPAPLLAGIAYMFIPYHGAHSLGHFGAMQLEWIPFIAACVLSFVRSPRLYKTVLLGVLLTIQAWTEHHYIVWIAIFGLLAGFVYRSELRSGDGIRKIPRVYFIVLAIMVFVGIVLPYIPTIRLSASNSDALELGIKQTIRFSADLFSFITPHPSHPLWGGMFDTLFSQFFTGNDAESVQYLGVSILLAILFFHRHIPVKQRRLWILLSLVFGIMSLGPVLHVFGKETSLSLPYSLLAHAPVFSAIRVIARAGVMVSFATIVLFGWVIATNQPARKANSHFFYISIGLLLLLEFAFFPFPTQSAKLSPVYSTLQGLPGSTVIEIPAATNYVAASRALYASAEHKKEVLGSIALERGQDEDAFTLVKSIPGIRQLLYLRTTDLAEARKEFFGQNISETLPDAMKFMGVSGIIVHADSLSMKQNSAIQDFLETNPTFSRQSFDDAFLYTFTPNETQKTDGVFMIRGDGWENVGYDAKKQSQFVEVSHTAAVQFVNENPYPVSIVLQYSLTAESKGELQVEREFIVEPGQREIVFTHTGEGKSILQNPSFIVSPL